ncbi:hypothetical protein [Sphingomonas sanxanigenens]|uniref:Uncharacterized protein n=1 Tax=Sphingomonas sanxanigenens DSM 19645 = NX02 TaxID=1123269 RepID=W0AAG7_9SPHN|nr:hypothetical protein [Sphingomonas sanxanigenens]AHE52655.1 hypothetical protein NX02_04560 [Sphingomonas sanxanigenens DSM 19645 = NX02]
MDEAELLAGCTIEIWPPRQTGGQVVGPGPQGVKITHPSGLTAICEYGRSQHVNKMIATDMLLAAVTHPRFR